MRVTCDYRAIDGGVRCVRCGDTRRKVMFRTCDVGRNPSPVEVAATCVWRKEETRRERCGPCGGIEIRVYACECPSVAATECTIGNEKMKRHGNDFGLPMCFECEFFTGSVDELDDVGYKGR